MRRVLVLTVGLLAAACPKAREHAVSGAAPSADAATIVDAAIANASGATDASVDAPCTAPPTGAQIANGRCAKDADCVLTDAPAQCDACNVERVYPTLASALAHRNATCGGVSRADSADSADAAAGAARCGCPPPDTYTRAFYRAECREHRCIAFRYHGGG